MDERSTTEKSREVIPDVLNAIRRAQEHATLIDDQMARIGSAFGLDRDVSPNKPKDEPTLPLLRTLEQESYGLADYLLHIQKELTKHLNTLFGDLA